MTPEYKAEKEASVSFLGGGGIWEINGITLAAPVAALLWALLQTRQGFFKPYTLPAGVTDFLIHCGGILFATTIYSGGPQILLALLLLPAVAVLSQPPSTAVTTSKPAAKPEQDGKPKAADEPVSNAGLDPLPVKPFITTYRGAMMIITCTSILAVDFKVFPRRFAKTESFGTSLMDLGVGSFVFAAGIVAARQQLKEQQSGSPSLLNRFKTAMRHSAPLLALGLLRLWTVKGLDYAEHVSEYGVHWNFFFTLALLPPVIAVLQPVLRLIPSYGALAFVIGGIYECVLYFVPDMKVFLILSERKPGDWLSQNREGVFSCIGYLAIFIAGMGIGMSILPRDPGPELPEGKAAEKDVLDEDSEWLASVLGQENQPAKASAPEPDFMPGIPKMAIAFLAKWTGIWFILAVWAMWRYGPHLFVSRRMANLAYIIWVCAFNTAQLLLFCAIETVMFPALYKAKDKATERQRAQDATSKVMQAFNRNGLALFLLANLLTGAINIAVPTWHMDDVPAMAILLAYIAVICGVGLALDSYDVSIKL
ncbi:hypothetical protein BAUCODRAFT_145697 [Baudoinia panamericana UAMH 10762]|uniref:GPI-anchored wall transfer protein n=1 Tax=Baudoinia panamericana (strain UAMH 10762) TaxID=717646 RepID=M2N3T4_BAUPA|nr:uncharacterized protein BAUCODRAFT_145697 [Baudoinia panamericana UAMH 10762]EMC98643.1 hypothetical protein BAUCODRAFT_145697 [Baudoinia panamericana UAMH 10762]